VQIQDKILIHPNSAANYRTVKVKAFSVTGSSVLIHVCGAYSLKNTRLVLYTLELQNTLKG